MSNRSNSTGSSSKSQTAVELPISKETRVLNLKTGTSILFSKDPSDREVKWLGIEDDVIWLKDTASGATEVWVGDAAEREKRSYCAGKIASYAFHLKLKRLFNEHDDIAIAVACPTTSTGGMYTLKQGEDVVAEDEVTNAIWYTTLRKKPVTEDGTEARYIISPTKWANALRGTGLESPMPSPLGSMHDFDISSSGIVFLSKDTTGGSPNFPSINVYYIPLKTFTEVSRPRPQIIRVKDYEGRSSHPVFSPNGGSVAFLKKQHPIDQNDRNRIIVINRIRDFRAYVTVDDMPTQQSEKSWHLSPFTFSWSDNGTELYVVAVDHGIRRLFKIPAALSSIKKEPEPITSESNTPADVRHLRMVFSAPMEARP
ncbi:uncharacterized protein KY384_004739 [Bacidia gigantensis]|uniref:uncharacterized protein n=1 Tax=Bacidia gigantensis TaxID=2732470 RepID=UPI001D057DC2|nr:uncharacterized protein KY384_004739 [Bacidia gigantensis]KAG8530239.1 hypothetical protein KY384_004739 [Bacidia gigantensis]